MTVQQMITSVYEELGEPSDLYIYDSGGSFDLTQAGSQKILLWLNRAYQRILNWKFPNGEQVRFACQDGEVYFDGTILSGTAVSATSTTVTLDTAVLAVTDEYLGCVIRITSGTGVGQYRYIVGYTSGRVATVNRSWSTNPDATSVYSVYRRRYWFRDSAATGASENIAVSPANAIHSPRKLIDTTDGSEIELDSRTQSYDSNLEEIGTPSSYLWRGNSIVFDVAPDEAHWYLLEYNRMATAFSTASQEPEIPSSFHEPLYLYATWIGLRRAQEWTGAYSTKRDIVDLMQSLKTGLEMAFERNDIHVEVEP